MASWATVALPSKHLPRLSAAIVFTTGAAIPCCRRTCSNTLSFFRNDSCTGHNCLRVESSVVGCENTNPLETGGGVWEDPDDGSESEDEDEENEEVKENDIDFESDWEEEQGPSSFSATGEAETVVEYEDKLLREAVQLLEPEERAILQQNATPNLEKITTEKWNVLHTLALAGQITFFDNLLENGLHIDHVDKNGLTALHVAVIGKKEAVISHLLRKGANPHVKDKNGVTPLHYAVQVGAMQTVKLLIKNNVDVNSSDNDGWTPLHIAMQSRNRDIAKVLLIYGADSVRKNKDGKTPLDLSLAYGKEFKSYDLTKLLKLVPASRKA